MVLLDAAHYKITICTKEATTALIGIHVDPLSRSNGNLEKLFFQEGGKPENPAKTPLGLGGGGGTIPT